MNLSSPRSYLFVPGDRPDRFEKARAAGADAVIFDLEDAVSMGQKLMARESVRAHLDASRPAWLRINAFETPWFAGDVATLASHPGTAGIVLPKCEGPEQIAAVLEHAHPQLVILPLVETARGVANLDVLCNAPRVQRIVFGTLDFQIDLGIDCDGEALNIFRSRIVLASRLAGIGAPVDGVTTALDDIAAIEAHARRGRNFGFGGKLCIHPKQLDAIHRAYAWSDAERAWADRVLLAAERSGGGAVAVDGRMVDMPVIQKAQRIIQSN